MNKPNQTKRNFIWNVISLVSNVIIGLLYTPFLVQHIGITAYGVVPLALIINQYVSVITGSLTGTLTRFYTVNFQKGDYEKASGYISTSLVVILGIIGILSIISIYFINSINTFFTISDDLVQGAKVLFSCTLISFAVSLLSSVLNVTLYAVNKLDYLNFIKIGRAGFKFLYVALFFYFADVNLNYLGYSILLGEITVFLFSAMFFYRLKPVEVHLKWKSINKTFLAGIAAISSWTILHQIGDMGIYRTDNILVNNFYGLKMSGILGAISELGMYVIGAVSVMGSLFGPLILIAYSKDDHIKVRELTIMSSFYVGLITAILVGVVIGFSDSVLTIWLGEEFAQYTDFLFVKLVVLPFYSAAGIFAFVYRAWNRVKTPAIATLMIGIANLCGCYVICKYNLGGVHSINIMLVFSAIIVIIQSFILNSFIYSVIYKGERSKLVRIFISVTTTIIISALLSYLYNSYFDIKSIVSLGIGLLIMGIILLIITYFIMTSKAEKENLKLLLNLIK